MLLHESFESHAARRPYAVALTVDESPGERHLTYGELNTLANQYAHTLIGSGVGAEIVVGLHLSPGVELIAAMLGVMKAGGAYVPLDPDLPVNRLAQILEMAKPAVIMTQRVAVDRLPGHSAQLVFAGSDSPGRAHGDDPRIPVTPNDLCYVMFTSGSTGAPKGVMVTHGNLSPLFDDIGARLGIDAGDVWTAFHPFSFGYSIWEIWGALRHGGRLVIVPAGLRTDPARLFELVRTQRVTIMSQTPSAFRQNLLSAPFADGLGDTALRLIVLSGEAVDSGALQRWFARHRDDGVQIVNTYAITETSGQLTYAQIEANDCDGQKGIGVGSPLMHAELAIVDEDCDEGCWKTVEAGQAGELFVGGPGVARGYIGLAEQTEQRFVTGSIAGHDATRWYRTGDRARLTENKTLEFLGRTDEQVKLRGYRIEPGEIAAVLRDHPAIDDAVVMMRDDQGGDARLVGYVVPHASARAGRSARPEFWPSVGPYQLYDEFLYDLMSSEAERLASYREAFERSVRDRVVLDIGTGEHALLARMCVEAGARRVYAVEILEEAYRKAHALVHAQGLADRIHVIRGDIAALELPEPVEVCTQGIIGNIGSADGIVPIWNHARRHFAPDCVPVPVRCRTMIAAVELPETLVADPSFSPVADRYARQVFDQAGRQFDIRLCVSDLPEHAIISDAHVFEDLDFATELAESSSGGARLTINRAGRLDGYLVWTVVSTGGETDVDYRRTQRAWLPVFFPLGETGDRPGIPVSERDKIDVEWHIGVAPGAETTHPDYRVITTLSADGQSSTFEYLSRVDETALNSTPLYRSMWSRQVESTQRQEADSLAPGRLHDWLAERLPDYMVPNAWVELERLPLTSHHKLDRSALPAPSKPAGGQAAPARDELECDLVALWQEILKTDCVGIHDNFFDLGGDSISAVGLTSALQRLLDDAVMLVALFDAPTVAGLAQYLREHHEAAVTARYSVDAVDDADATAAKVIDAGDAPLSFQQQSFWVLNRLYPTMTGSNEQFVIPLDGGIDIERLEAAWNAVLERHEILRTVFRETDAGVRQVVLPHEPVSLPVVELFGADGDDRFFDAAQETISKTYSLSEGPLIEALLFCLSPQRSKLLVNAHHIIADGLSIRIIRDELAELYVLPAHDLAARLPEPGLQYRDYSIRQRAESHGDGWERSLDFWRGVLHDAPDRTLLPSRAVNIANERWQGRQRRVGFEIDAETAEGIRELSRRANATLFMTLLAAFRVLLMRYSGQDDIVIGSPVTSRETGAMRGMVGCLVNNVVFRNRVTGDESFDDVLTQERASALAALQHSGVPFEHVVEALRPRRRFGEHPLFQILFLYEDAYQRKQRAGDLEFGLETLNTSRSSYWDIELSVSDYGAGGAISGYVGYSTSRFEDEFAESLPAHYASLLRGIVATPQTSVSRLGLLEDECRHQILVDWNETECDWPGPDTLHQRFTEQVASSPDAVALIGDDTKLSYRELSVRVDRLARRLYDHGVGPGDRVGIGVGRSVELVTAIIATLKTGAVYVPLDPNYPALRLQYIVAQTGLRMILADARLPRSVSGTLDTIRLDEPDSHRPDEVTFESPEENVDAAYILYTSGSSGAPKGVIGLHAGAVSRCEWMWHEYGFTVDDVFCLRTSPNFVDSVWEIFGPLTHGAALRVLSDADVSDPARLVEQLATRVDGKAVSHIVLVPSLLTALLDTDSRLGRRLPDLRSWITSGEPLRPGLLRRFRRACPGVMLLNTYGTSEIWDATCFDTSAWNEDETIVPVGKPIAGVRTYILDKQMQPVPVGVVGELYAGGVGLGGGYLDQPELNAKKFVPDPFSTKDAQRMFRTGDLARFRADGCIELLGRADRQIKLRGFRIEPDEIATVLRDHPGVADACVDLRQCADGEPVLAGYWQPAERQGGTGMPDEGLVTADVLRGFLKTRLPAYMLPGMLIKIERMPLTPNGKIDIRALPDPEPVGTNDPHRPVPFVAPGTETERAVAAIWGEILGIDRVGLHDDFFDSGGHSLSATRLLARLRSHFDISPDLAQFFDAPTVISVARHIDDAHENIVDHVPANQAVGPGRLERSDRLALSFAQERLWFLNELDPDSPAYNIAFTIHLTGELDLGTLQSAVDMLVQRHEALRTRFLADDGRPYQEVLADVSVPLSVEVIESHDTRKWEQRLADLSAQSFALDSGPLLRLHVLQGDPQNFLLLVVIHHIVSDGLSNGIFFDELATLYDCVANGRESTLPELPIQYADFSQWQRQSDKRPELDAQLEYWTGQLRDVPPALELPTDRPRPAEQMFRGAWLWRELSGERAETLRVFGRRHRCTLFMVLLGAFDVLLNRYSGQDDFVVGSPIAGRSWYELDGLIGLFVNTVALRMDLGDDPTFAELLGRVRRTTLESQANQDLPFERLVETLRPDRTLSHAPVFQVMFNMTPIPDLTRQSGGVCMRIGQLQDHGVSTFDLTLSVGERADGLDLVFEYDRDLFDRRTIERIATHYDYLLGAIVAAADSPVSALPLWPDDQSAALLERLNPVPVQTDTDESPAPGSVLELFEYQVESRPAAMAVESGEDRLTYEALDLQADRLAGRLHASGVEPGSCVAVCIDRSCELLVAVLGVLKAGCAYVPLDVTYPSARLANMFAVIRPGALVTQTAITADLSFATVPTLVIDEHETPGTDKIRQDWHRPKYRPRPDDMAYALFTSGSTGTPKAVAVSHANLASIGHAWIDAYDLTEHDRHLQMASFSFDVFTGDWVRALCSGGCLVLCPRIDLLEPARLFQLLRTARVTCAEFVPAVLRCLLAWLADSGQDLSFMRLIAVGSDTWHGSEYAALADVAGTNVRVINSYGTAETTIDSTYFEADGNAQTELLNDAPVPIGRPFAGSRVYVCDADLRLVPPGVPGELCIGGAGVSAGYIGAPDLNAEKFVADPFKPGGRLYRTGDRARYLDDGTLVLLGRMDRQVKLRGFRIELGEIEVVLQRHPAVTAGIVDCVSSGNDRRLVAWVVAANAPVDIDALRSELRVRLPDYMVPAWFVELDALPMTPNGKIDRQRLPVPENDNRLMPLRTEPVRPVGPVESVLLELFRTVLGVSPVVVHDSFFDLGGHSLLATQLVSRIRDVLDIELPLRTLFEDATVTGIAAAIGRQSGVLPPPLRSMPLGPNGTAPVSLPQQRLWFLAKLEPGSSAYHLHWAVRLRGVLDRAALSRAVDALVARHESLRTTFVAPAGEPLQRIAGRLSVPVEVVEADRSLEELIALPFDLESGPLLRIHLIECGHDEHILLLVIHHIISDGWSMSVLSDELSRAYNACRRDALPDWEMPDTSGLSVQYADYAVWQRERLSGAELQRQTEYWRESLAGAPGLLELPIDRPRPALQTHAGAWLSKTLPAELTASLQTVGRTEHCTLFMVLLAAFDMVLARYTGATDIVIGTPIAGRGRTELEGLIGFFVNTLVLRTSVDGNPTYRQLLGRVRKTSLDAYAHQELPFEKLVEVLSPSRNRSYNPIVQVLFTVHNQPVNLFVPDGLTVEPVDVSNDAAKFDLSIHVAERDGGLQCGFGYNPDLFDASTIESIAACFESILTTVSGDPDVRLSELGLLPAPADAADWSGHLVERFVEQVRRAPESDAVRTGTGALSYGALNEKANGIAQQLLSLSLVSNPDVPRIGLLGTYDERLVAGLLGILKAGCAWVPLDPVWPADRLETITADAGLAAVVTDQAHLEQACGLSELTLPLVVVKPLDDMPAVAANPDKNISADALACIIYTSGSTGTPKGVVQTHRGVVIQAGRYSESLRLGPGDRLSGLSGYAYDAAIQDIFGALLNGAALHPQSLRDSDGRMAEPSNVLRKFDGDAITIAHMTPSLFRYLFNDQGKAPFDGSSIRAVVLGGEAMRRADFERYRSHFVRGTRLINGLGLTESTMALQFSADHDTRLQGSRVPIGTAVAGLKVDLLDQTGSSGWCGEIVLTGTGLSPGYWPSYWPGYWNKSEQDSHAERFAAVRSLHTGDFGYRLPDGQIVYMGRRDGRVNIRGYRVELGEIEAALSELPGVADSAARLWPADEDPWLAAYIVVGNGADPQPDELYEALADRLPAFMLPQSFEYLDVLPRLANGKQARGELPAPSRRYELSASAPIPEPARNELETALVSIWCDLLQLDTLGIHDNFFSIGGHSLLATRVIARIRDQLGTEIPLGSIFDAPTVAGLAGIIDSVRNGNGFGEASVPALTRIARERHRRS